MRESLLISFVHGQDGLGGVEGLLGKDDERVQAKLRSALAGNAVLGMAKALQTLSPGERLTISATGSLTNVALLIKLFPELVRAKVDEVVIMGGAEGRGNKTPVAEVCLARLGLYQPHSFKWTVQHTQRPRIRAHRPQF